MILYDRAGFAEILGRTPTLRYTERAIPATLVQDLWAKLIVTSNLTVEVQGVRFAENLLRTILGDHRSELKRRLEAKRVAEFVQELDTVVETAEVVKINPSRLSSMWRFVNFSESEPTAIQILAQGLALSFLRPRAELLQAIETGFAATVKQSKLSVTHNLWRDHLVSPKTDDSAANVPLASTLVDALQEHRRKVRLDGTGRLCFSKLDGSSCDPDQLRNDVLYPALEAAGIERVAGMHGFHLFRHSAAA